MLSKNGFTLVEIAIVILIISLVVGGVLVGQNLVRGSQTQALVSDIETVTSALQTFRTKYKALPGDMPNATSFWTEVAANCTSAAGTLLQTCNGSGNERIAENSASEDYETFRLWQHLALSGIIAGNYTGVSGGGSTFDVTSSNAMISSDKKGLYSVRFRSTVRASSVAAATYNTNNFFDTDCGNCILMGAAVTGAENYGALLSANEARQMDEKIDDGKPATGLATSGYLSVNTTCTTTLVATTALYSTSDNILCSLLIRTGQ